MMRKLDDVIQEIIRCGGDDVLSDPKRFVSMMSDIAPEMKTERNIIRAVSGEALPMFLNLKNASEGSAEAELKRIKKRLEEHYGITDEWSAAIISGFAGALGIKHAAAAKKNAGEPRTENADVRASAPKSAPKNKYVKDGREYDVLPSPLNYVGLFGGGKNPPPQRVYEKTFFSSAIMYVYFRAEFSPIKQPIKTTFDYAVTREDGTTMAKSSTPVALPSGSSSAQCGCGFDAYGKWEAGHYTYTVSVGNSNTITGAFDVVGEIRLNKIGFFSSETVDIGKNVTEECKFLNTAGAYVGVALHCEPKKIDRTASISCSFYTPDGNMLSKKIEMVLPLPAGKTLLSFICKDIRTDSLQVGRYKVSAEVNKGKAVDAYFEIDDGKYQKNGKRYDPLPSPLTGADVFRLEKNGLRVYTDKFDRDTAKYICFRAKFPRLQKDIDTAFDCTLQDENGRAVWDLSTPVHLEAGYEEYSRGYGMDIKGCWDSGEYTYSLSVGNSKPVKGTFRVLDEFKINSVSLFASDADTPEKSGQKSSDCDIFYTDMKSRIGIIVRFEGKQLERRACVSCKFYREDSDGSVGGIEAKLRLAPGVGRIKALSRDVSSDKLTAGKYKVSVSINGSVPVEAHFEVKNIIKNTFNGEKFDVFPFPLSGVRLFACKKTVPEIGSRKYADVFGQNEAEFIFFHVEFPAVQRKLNTRFDCIIKNAEGKIVLDASEKAFIGPKDTSYAKGYAYASLNGKWKTGRYTYSVCIGDSKPLQGSFEIK